MESLWMGWIDATWTTQINIEITVATVWLEIQKQPFRSFSRDAAPLFRWDPISKVGASSSSNADRFPTPACPIRCYRPAPPWPFLGRNIRSISGKGAVLERARGRILFSAGYPSLDVIEQWQPLIKHPLVTPSRFVEDSWAEFREGGIITKEGRKRDFAWENGWDANVSEFKSW